MLAKKSLNIFFSAGAGQVIALLSQLIIIKILTNHLSINEFGLFSLIIIIPALVLPIVFSEIATAMNRYFFEENKYHLYFNCIMYLITSFSLLFLILFACSGFINSALLKFEINISNQLMFIALLNHLFIYMCSVNLSFFKIN